MTDPRNDNKELHFNYLDEIPSKIREHLRSIQLVYDVAENSDSARVSGSRAQRGEKQVPHRIRKIRGWDSG